VRPLADETDAARDPEPRGNALDERARRIAGALAAHDHVEEVGETACQLGQLRDDPVMPLALVEPAHGEDDGRVEGQPQRAPRVRGLPGDEDVGVHPVRDDADMLGGHPQPRRDLLEGLAHREHASGAPERPADLRAVQGIVPQPDDAAPERNHHGHAEDAAEERGGQPVRVREVRVDEIEREAPPEPREER
jgi:hypothetical protein